MSSHKSHASHRTYRTHGTSESLGPRLALSEQPKYKHENQDGRNDTAAEFISRRTRQTTS